MLLMDKYADKIYGTITCYDRMIIQGYIPGWSHAEGMTGYLNANNIRIFDFSNFSQPLTEQVRTNAQRIADENGIEIEFIRKLRAFRKDDRIQEIIQKTGKTEGLVHIFSSMEQCNTYKPWHDRATGKTFLKFDQSKCLHYYFYFIDKELGLCYLRVPTWAPFRLQFYMNGHSLGYTWTVQQIECATDVMFKQPGDLEPLYDEIIRTAIFTVKPDNIATFLGQRITYNCKKEVGTNYNQRILGTRIKHHMGGNLQNV